MYDFRGDTLQSLTRQGSFDAESSHPNSTLPTVSSSYGFVNTVDHVFLDDEDDSLPHAYSTFFETSTLDSNRGCNLLKPKFIEPTNFFPGDDIDEDVPWIGKNPMISYSLYGRYHTAINGMFSSVLCVVING